MKWDLVRVSGNSSHLSLSYRGSTALLKPQTFTYKLVAMGMGYNC